MCRALHAGERSLVQTYRNRPFAILGVDLDGDREAARRAVAEDGVTWPSWWDPHLELARAMHVGDFVPSVFIIDCQGRIRYIPSPNGVDGEAVRALIAQLVAEAEKNPRPVKS